MSSCALLPCRMISTLLALTVALVASSSVDADDAKPVRAFLTDLSAHVAQAEKAGKSALEGQDGWLFFVPELRSLSVGPFWAEHASHVSRSANPQYADPLSAIVDFHHQLKTAGVELLIVPVPGKAVIYPDEVSSQVPAPTPDASNRLDGNHQQFYELLKAQGVPVLDLTPRFLASRPKAGPPLYCKTDTHWSGLAIDLTAQAIKAHVQDRPWLKDMPSNSYESERRDVEITGDLARMIHEAHPSHETVPLTFVGTRRGGSLVPVATSRTSPVLLMGDSHTLVFHDPELFAQGAGLPDHLALHLGFPVDLIGIRGSGSTTTRIELLRRRDNLKGKKLVIWCFSSREFTESVTGWRKVPVIR